MTRSSAPAGHLAHLDGVRAVTALFVVIHHALLTVYPNEQPLTGWAAPLQLFYYGHYAVGIFIVLSGYCLMIPVVSGDGSIRGGVARFIRRRAVRILPPYYFAVLLSLLLIALLVGQKTGTHWDISLPVTAKSLVSHALLVHDLVHEDFTINHALWSIAVEWRIYFLFPLCVLVWRRFGTVAVAVTTVLASYVLLRLGHRLLGVSMTAQYLGLFGIGMAAAAISFGRTARAMAWRRWPWGWITLATFSVFAFALSAPVWHGETVHAHIADYLVGLFAGALLVALTRNGESMLTTALSWKPLVFVGTFAYSLYLIHSPLLQVFWQYVFSGLQGRPLTMFAALSLVATPAIVGLSYLFFLAAERPFLRKRSGVTPRAAVLNPIVDPAP